MKISPKIHTLFLGLLVFFWPAVGFAQQTLGSGDPIKVDTGVRTTVDKLFGGIVNTLFVWAFAIATAIFLIGALFMVASGGEENVLTNAKRLMKGSLIGFAIVLGSWMILSTFLYFLLE